MTERPTHILIIDDEDRYAALCHRLLPKYQYVTPCHESGCPPCQREDCTSRNAHHWYEAKELFAKHKKKIDVVLLDLRFDLPREKLLPEGLPESGPELEKAKRLQGIEILRRIRRDVGDVPVILMTRHDEIAFEDMADALSASDYTYLAADEGLNLKALESQISSIMAQRQEQNTSPSFVWGKSASMLQLRHRLEFLALGDRPVLILGETGTGKSYFVRNVLHAASKRKGPFAQLDLAALPDTLLASELFGTAKGAFSGSVEREGAFEYAHTGTLFLDEIGNLPQDAQRRLLTVLQEKEVTRLGENRPRKVDVKICAATNANIEEAVQKKQFRNDLYMRLNPAARIELPPLRERREDIEALCQFLAQKIFKEESNANLLQKYAQQSRISLSAENVLLSFHGDRGERQSLCFVLPEKSAQELIEHQWPGNVRQLEMVLANLLLLTLVEALATPSRTARQVLPVSPRALRDLLRQSELGHSEIETKSSGAYEVELKPSRTLHEAARSWEVTVYQRLFAECQGDFGQMAKRLLGDGSEQNAKKVRLRFNQLGLKARGGGRG
jgi:DNA-binding NtrC family response regulator